MKMIKNPFLDEDRAPIQEVLRQTSRMFISMPHEKLLILAADYIDELEIKNKMICDGIESVCNKIDAFKKDGSFQ
jgi:hypothetical protein